MYLNTQGILGDNILCCVGPVEAIDTVGPNDASLYHPLLKSGALAALRRLGHSGEVNPRPFDCVCSDLCQLGDHFVTSPERTTK